MVCKAVEIKKTRGSGKLPFSDGFIAGDFVFTAGQVGIDPNTGNITDAVTDQTRLALENIKAVLAAAGAKMSNVIKTTVYLVDMTYFDEMNKVYSTYFDDPCPARSTIQAKLARPQYKVEIEAVAYVGK
jgi:2-iminobutanoate/2-iminopropanoate deaminase